MIQGRKSVEFAFLSLSNPLLIQIAYILFYVNIFHFQIICDDKKYNNDDTNKIQVYILLIIVLFTCSYEWISPVFS